jgi:hypothetical protein
MNNYLNTLLKSFWTDLLINCLTSFGVDSSWPVLDCCAGDTSLVFSLMEHFTEVSSNDLSKNCPTQTHCDVTDKTYWTSIKGKYAGVVTEPPQDLAIMFNIINNSLNIGIQFCAFMVDVEYEKILDTARVLSPLLIVSVKSLKMNVLLWISTTNLPSTKCIHFGEDLIQLWRSDPTTFKDMVTRKVTDSCVRSSAEEDEPRIPPINFGKLGSGNGDHGLAEKRRVFDKQKDTETLRPLPLKLFGSPSDQGRILQNFYSVISHRNE